MSTLIFAETMHEAQRELAALETHYGMTTEEFLTASKDSAQLKRVDTFDKIEWHFRVEQLQTLKERSALQLPVRHYPYASARPSRLPVHETENELELVA
jgi:hypothetical protein